MGTFKTKDFISHYLYIYKYAFTDIVGYSLNKNKYYNYDIVKTPSKYNINQFSEVKYDSKYDSYIEIFYNTLRRNISSSNSVLFHNNIDSLNIMETKKIDSCSKNMVTCGNYIFKDNLIKLVNINSIYHELLHMSSSLYIDGNIYSGFFQLINSPYYYVIGSGLLEGYTSLLEERYFKDSYIESYTIEKAVAGCIELIIGKDKMEKYYFNADLHGLIEELKRYNSYSNIIKFIKNLDFIRLNIDKDRTNLCTYKIKISLYQIESFFNNCIKASNNKLYNDMINTIMDSVNPFNQEKIHIKRK